MNDEMLTLLPFAIVAGVAILIILVDLFWPKRDNVVMAVGLGGLLVALAATLLIGPLPGDWGALGEGGSMGPTLGSFAEEQDASRFAERFGGRVLHFDDVTIEEVAPPDDRLPPIGQ